MNSTTITTNSSSPSFDVLSRLTADEQQEWLEGFRAFFKNADVENGPAGSCWDDGWVAASEEALHVLRTSKTMNSPSLAYGRHGVGFAAWRWYFIDQGLLPLLACECAAADIPELRAYLPKGAL